MFLRPAISLRAKAPISCADATLMARTISEIAKLMNQKLARRN